MAAEIFWNRRGLYTELHDANWAAIPEPVRDAETKEQVAVRHLQVLAQSEQERMVARRFYAPAFFVLSCSWLLIATVLLEWPHCGRRISYGSPPFGSGIDCRCDDYYR